MPGCSRLPPPHLPGSLSQTTEDSGPSIRVLGGDAAADVKLEQAAEKPKPWTERPQPTSPWQLKMGPTRCRGSFIKAPPHSCHLPATLLRLPATLLHLPVTFSSPGANSMRATWAADLVVMQARNIPTSCIAETSPVVLFISAFGRGVTFPGRKPRVNCAFLSTVTLVLLDLRRKMAQAVAVRNSNFQIKFDTVLRGRLFRPCLPTRTTGGPRLSLSSSQLSFRP